MAGSPRLVVGGSATPEASILIATRQDAARLEQCLQALANHTAGVAIEIVIVLNGAEPEVRDLVDRRVDGPLAVHSEANLGFPAAINLARRHASAPFLVILHDDAVVHRGWLSALLSAAADRPDAGIIGALNLRSDGRIRAAGSILLPDAATVPRGADAPADDPRFAERTVVDYCAGCCMLIRREVWDAVGGMDESLFPAGYGDVHMALAARRLGWTVLCEPAARVTHDDGGGSLPTHFRRWAFAANRERILATWGDDLRGEDTAGELPPRAAAPADELSLLRQYATEVDLEIEALMGRIAQREGELSEITGVRAQLEDALRRGGHEHAVAARALARVEELERQIAAMRAPGRSGWRARVAARAGRRRRPSTAR